jgi:H/ACA ribonucleoprotein complex subunit 4
MRVTETLVKSEGETDPRYGCKPNERPIQEHIRLGIVNLDKPPGPSSHEVVAWLKNILSLKHAGHGGTLEIDSIGDTPKLPASFQWPSKKPLESSRRFSSLEKSMSA